jgi:EAL domain-containing protein (putative c-di-GMP-specific phosphodiesterase class I)
MEVNFMPGRMVRIRKETQNILRELAANEGKPMQAILDLAIEEYRRQRFLQEANAAYAALRNNPKAWKAEIAERKAWDATMADGQEDK